MNPGDLEVAAPDVARRMTEGDAPTLLDCREPEEWRMARIDQATLIPMNDLAVRFNELDPESEIVVFCHHGRRSMSVTLWLREQGFANVRSLRGGIDAWSREVDPNVPRY